MHFHHQSDRHAQAVVGVEGERALHSSVVQKLTVDDAVVGQQGSGEGPARSHQARGILLVQEELKAVADRLQQWEETRP